MSLNYKMGIRKGPKNFFEKIIFKPRPEGGLGKERVRTFQAKGTEAVQSPWDKKELGRF